MNQQLQLLKELHQHQNKRQHMKQQRLRIKQLTKQQSQLLNPQELLLKLHVMPQQHRKPRKLHMMLSKQPLQLRELVCQLSELNQFVLKKS
jgi:hypothetical protein